MASFYFPEHMKILENSNKALKQQAVLACFSQTWHDMKACLSGGCWTGNTTLIGQGWLVWDRLDWNHCDLDKYGI